MADIPWYSDATLFTDIRLRRAGTLVQCVRKWGLLSADDQPDAHIKLSVKVDGHLRLDSNQIAALTNDPSFINA